MPSKKRPASSVRILFGRRLREERHAREITLEELAERSDMNWSYIAQVERGVRNVSIDNMAALADGLGLPLRDLL
ncbi:helix-turn-helix domain-containing protein [Deinococcus sp. QL22]|uniref:helix-turn-helix domain-containing protein n=1 Tax=Deinococcus sp. QL22 TaxID=2939437 RepID=UPI002017DF2E|nr:helix-turn-helix transcriptional regulator [Deinococcus sp. QL22]UQN09452.1 helix-turn-helix domain-containing protein [Deinococcus sp. QL22]